jgi:hypothetical protein
VVPLTPPAAKPHPFALFNLGFRPFFLLAAVFSLLSIPLWTGSQLYAWPLPAPQPVAPAAWHAHEMIFGYALAVVAGFLLTAVRNWTNLPTLRGSALAAACALWLAARLIMGFAPGAWHLAARDPAPACGRLVMPKCHWLPFFVWCISGSRSPVLFLVELSAAIRVASTMVPWRIKSPRSARWALMASSTPQ